MTNRLRRRLVLLSGAAALHGATPAQPARLPRVAWVSMDRADPQAPFLAAFLAGLRALGWTEGRDILVDRWWGDGALDKLRSVVPQIAASQPDVIVVSSGLALRPLIDARLPQPLVFAYSADVVLARLVDSWARPGVNRTGISYFALDLVPKRLDLMKALLPRLKRVAIIGWPPHAGEDLELQAARGAAEQLGLTPQYHGVLGVAELDAAFEAIEAWRAEAMLVFGGAVASAHGARIAAFAARRRIPAVSSWAAFAEQGNVMSYGPVLQECQARLASFVDRLLKGAKAAEMPVELPTRIELVINLKAARTLGIDVPGPLLLRADRVIE